MLPFQGVIACDGHPLVGLMERRAALGSRIRIHILADIADSGACDAAARIPARLVCLSPLELGVAKLDLVQHLGVDHTVVIGHGRSETLMLESTVLGIAVLGCTRLSCEAARHADVIARHTVDALGSLPWPGGRLLETLIGVDPGANRRQ